MNPTETSIARDILAYLASCVQEYSAEEKKQGYWVWSNQAAPPLSGQVRTDSRDWINAKQLYIDKRTSDGVDVNAAVAAIKSGDEIKLSHQTDDTRYAQFKVTGAPTLVVNAFTVPVSYSAGTGVIPNSGTRIEVEQYIPPGAAATPTPVFGIGSPLEVGVASGEGIIYYYRRYSYDTPPGVPFLVTVNVTQLNTNRMRA